jgi:uncharacterized protein (TIGR03032 family)
MLAQTDLLNEWKHKDNMGKGLVMDVETNEVICEGLCSPHSLRYHDGKLWLLEAGTGFLGYIDVKKGNGDFRRVKFVPGFARGLDMVGKYAVLGTSLDRNTSGFNNLPLSLILDEVKKESKCGIWIVNIETEEIEHILTFKQNVNELYDLAIVRNVGTLPYAVDTSVGRADAPELEDMCNVIGMKSV